MHQHRRHRGDEAHREHHVDVHEHDRQPGTRLPEPDGDLYDFHPEQQPGPQRQAQHLRHAERQREHDDGQREQQVGGPAVHVLPEDRIETVARGGVVARVRTRAGEQDADDDGDQHDDARHVDEHRVAARHREPSRPRLGVDAHDVRGRDRDEGRRDDEVQPDDRRVQVQPHRDPADDGLHDDADADREGEARQLGARRPEPHDGEEGEKSDDDQHTGERAVAELDQTVQAQLGGRHERLRRAVRPGLAPHARAGEAHETAGADDHDVADQQQPGQHPGVPGDAIGQERRQERRSCRGRGGGGRIGHGCRLLGMRLGKAPATPEGERCL